MAIPVQKLPSLEEAFNGTLFGNANITKPDDKKVVMVEPSDLIEIEDQPFHPYTTERLTELAEDIKENGQINPCTVRLKDGLKIILAGRNRKKACEIAGVKVACLFIECDDATGNLILVNSNLNQRQELLPSEKAFAYKLQKESYEAKGQRKSIAAVAEQNSENVKMIQRYIKLTDLNKPLMDMVDDQRIPVTVGVEMSYFKPHNMKSVSSYLQNSPEQKVSIQQVQELRGWDSEKDFNDSWLNDFFHDRIKKVTEEHKKKCPVHPGFCDNQEVMKKRFLRNGNIEGCAGCCSCCRNKNSCEFVCDSCRPKQVTVPNLSKLKRYQHRDKIYFIQEDPDSLEKYAAFFKMGESPVLRLGTLPNSYDTPEQAEHALEDVAISRSYTEIPQSAISENTNSSELTPEEPKKPEVNQEWERPAVRPKQSEITESIGKPKEKPTSISIKIEDLEQIPCLFNFNEAEPDEINEFIISSLIQYFNSFGSLSRSSG